MVKIIVDSTCDLPKEYFKKYDIEILPLRVIINNEEYIDKVTVTVDNIYDSMRKGLVPKTSQPSPYDIYNIFEKNAKKGQAFIYLSFSSKLSGTYQTANIILNELKEKYKNVNMDIVDSKGGSTATGLIALQAAKLSQSGRSFKEIKDATCEMVENIEHIFTISDLKWLINGGRISKTNAIIGNVLNIKPIIQVDDGIIEVYKKVRGKKKSLNTIVDILEERIKGFTNQVIGISHASDLDTALKLESLIKERIKSDKIIINQIGSVLGTHLGIGGVGVFFFNKKHRLYIN